MIRSSLTKE